MTRATTKHASGRQARTASPEVPTLGQNTGMATGRAGVNLATLPWCLANWQPGYRVLVMEFTAKDVAAIPVGDGKFRVSKAKVIREVPQEQVHGWLGLNPDGSVVADER